jgi:hypothetical protein
MGFTPFLRGDPLNNVGIRSLEAGFSLHEFFMYSLLFPCFLMAFAMVHFPDSLCRYVSELELMMGSLRISALSHDSRSGQRLLEGKGLAR